MQAMEDALSGMYNKSQMKALTAGLEGQEVVLIQVNGMRCRIFDLFQHSPPSSAKIHLVTRSTPEPSDRQGVLLWSNMSPTQMAEATISMP